MTDKQEELPRRCIYNDVDMKHFMESSTKKELLNFVEAMGKACTSGDVAAFDPSEPLVGLTPAMACLHGALQEMVRWVDDFPPTSDQVRFGNPSFRLWHKRLMERSSAIITSILLARDDATITVDEACQRGKQSAAATNNEPKGDASIQQVSCYLHDSFGHAVRLDYGTGHESSFLVFLLVLSKVKCMGESPSLPVLRAVTLSIFDQYLKVTRRLQTEYRLEPAGSHGVFGLDDYHCLPFYFGACQLQANGVTPQELLNPKCQTDEHVLRDYGDVYMYLGCIRYIRELKKSAPFFESSPMLYDISQTLPSWDKVSRGLLRLYQGEVLDKRQVVQHFVFSKFFPCTWTPSKNDRDVAAPTETFRDHRVNIPTTRAPWAAANNNINIDDGADLIATRAPWATTSDGQNTQR
mmetsp:Transcript_30322/g.50378  ORF Transcript_30322/g.50378 Transcript_30322/m.50378 type:complete len:409 (-) Transcript_30322:1963-3189(-)